MPTALRPTVRPHPRADGSMSLLVDIMTSTLDPAYAQAACSIDGPRRSGRRRPRPVAAVLVLLVALGLLTGIATSQVRRGASQADVVRRSLVADVRQQTRDTDRLAASTASLRSDVARLRDAALGSGASGKTAAARVAALELATGTVAVHGPGVVVTLDDAPGPADPASARGGRAGDGRVYDRDVQDAVNALWAAGAEAVSINGQRLTALTAIRSAGEAVLVDLRPLSPPYVVQAIGDPGAIEPGFADSPAARRLSTYRSLYGLGFDVRRADRLDLPASAAPVLRVARAGTP